MILEENQRIIEESVRNILRAIGEDLEREGLKDTPRRVAKMYLNEIASQVGVDISYLLETTFDENHHELVIVKDIPFYSLCEHHLLPYRGEVHIGYIPEGKVVGISKLARVVEMASRRLTIQERLTSELADMIGRKLSPKGVMVVISAEHLCMTMRGVQKPGTKTVTSAVRGVFESDGVLRHEFLSLLNMGV